jgi:hypothetical protein
MKFTFRLERMLHFLRMKETMKKMELASVTQRIVFLGKRKTQVDEILRQLLSRNSEHTNTDWSYYETNKISLDAKESIRLGLLIQEETAHLEKKKRELSRLMMRKKGLEALKEKRAAEFKLVEARREQKKLDETFQLTKVSRRA